MALARSLKWLVGALLAPLLLALILIPILGWNWLRGPVERFAAEKTGRALVIGGDLTFSFGWPLPHIRARAVTFANPDWAQEKQMIGADAVDIAVDLPQLLRRNIVLPEVRLERPVVFLEQDPSGRKNWLLDLKQQDEGARIQVGRLTLDRGSLGYNEAGKNTHIRAEISSAGGPPGDAAGRGIAFSATGRYKGLPFKADGKGGQVLAIRDGQTPYPLTVDATIGRTRVKADGTVTGLLEFSALDMRLALAGDSIEQLYPLLGIAAPATRPYVTAGHLVHAGRTWRYEKFSGRIGNSDIAGDLQIATGGERPILKAELVSRLLDFADLGPLIGARRGGATQAKTSVPASGRVLPDLPFRTDRWNSVDADVRLSATTIHRAKELPLDNLLTHLHLHDSVLTLDPLDFGVAGGHLSATITLDGRRDPIQAHARVKAKNILIARLLPTVKLNQASIGQINGEFDLAGSGNSVGRMLANSSGKVALVVAGGEVSQLMLEQVGLHLWEILALKMTGDRRVKLRCAVADFDVKHGSMRANVLFLDTEVTTVVGTGSIDLAQEKLDLTLNPKTKNTSPLALRSPIHVRGSFANPVVEVDTGRIAARALGAIALGIVNPLLVLLPLVDAGPGADSDCGRLLRQARVMPRSAAKSEAPERLTAPGANVRQ